MSTELSHGYPVFSAGSPAVSLVAPDGVTTRDRVAVLLTSTGAEVAIAFGLLAAIFCAFLVRLTSVVISDMDEGTYLYAGKLVADGLAPYRDFLLAHPPLAVYLAAGWVKLMGADVMAARMANLTFVLASTVPLYLTVRHLARGRVPGLLAIVTYMTGNLLLANMGRTIKLEPLMNAFLIAAFAIYVLRPNQVSWRVLFGVLVGAAVLVKLVAVIPVGLIVLGDLIWSRPGRRFLVSWAAAALGAAIVLGPAALYLLGQPGFLDAVLFSQLQRGGLPLDLRWHYLAQDFTRYPPIPLALLASAWFMLRARDSRLRVAALVSLAGSTSLVLFFKTFFTYYLVLVMPWLAIVFVIACCGMLRRFSSHWRSLVVSLTLIMGVLVPIGYDEVYYRTGTMHVSSPANIIPLLQSGNGYIYSMYPLFALWSGRPAYPWYYTVDALIPRLTGRLTSADFIQAFSGSQAVVLYDGELNDYAEASAYLVNQFERTYHDGYFALWVRPS